MTFAKIGTQGNKLNIVPTIYLKKIVFKCYLNIKDKQQFFLKRDSLSATNGIKNKTNTGNIAILVQNKLDKAKNNKKRKALVWISGFSGLKGNENADKRVKLAVSITNITIPEQIPYVEFKSFEKMNIRNKWHIFGNNQNTKLNKMKKSISRWENANLKRNKEII